MLTLASRRYAVIQRVSAIECVSNVQSMIVNSVRSFAAESFGDSKFAQKEGRKPYEPRDSEPISVETWRQSLVGPLTMKKWAVSNFGRVANPTAEDYVLGLHVALGNRMIPQAKFITSTCVNKGNIMNNQEIFGQIFHKLSTHKLSVAHPDISKLRGWIFFNKPTLVGLPVTEREVSLMLDSYLHQKRDNGALAVLTLLKENKIPIASYLMSKICQCLSMGSNYPECVNQYEEFERNHPPTAAGPFDRRATSAYYWALLRTGNDDKLKNHIKSLQAVKMTVEDIQFIMAGGISQANMRAVTLKQAGYVAATMKNVNNDMQFPKSSRIVEAMLVNYATRNLSRPALSLISEYTTGGDKLTSSAIKSYLILCKDMTFERLLHVDKLLAESSSSSNDLASQTRYWSRLLDAVNHPDYILKARDVCAQFVSSPATGSVDSLVRMREILKKERDLPAVLRSLFERKKIHYFLRSPTSGLFTGIMPFRFLGLRISIAAITEALAEVKARPGWYVKRVDGDEARAALSKEINDYYGVTDVMASRLMRQQHRRGRTGEVDPVVAAAGAIDDEEEEGDSDDDDDAVVGGNGNDLARDLLSKMAVPRVNQGDNNYRSLTIDLGNPRPELLSEIENFLIREYKFKPFVITSENTMTRTKRMIELAEDRRSRAAAMAGEETPGGEAVPLEDLEAPVIVKNSKIIIRQTDVQAWVESK